MTRSSQATFFDQTITHGRAGGSTVMEPARELRFDSPAARVYGLKTDRGGSTGYAGLFDCVGVNRSEPPRPHDRI